MTDSDEKAIDAKAGCVAALVAFGLSAVILAAFGAGLGFGIEYIEGHSIEVHSVRLPVWTALIQILASIKSPVDINLESDM